MKNVLKMTSIFLSDKTLNHDKTNKPDLTLSKSNMSLGKKRCTKSTMAKNVASYFKIKTIKSNRLLLSLATRDVA
jgi:hypothetical protein